MEFSNERSRIVQEETFEPKRKEQMVSAIEARDVDRFHMALIDFNGKLTGGMRSADFADTKRKEADIKDRIQEFFSKLDDQDSFEPSFKVYLGDGGLSRLLIVRDDDMNIDVRLTSNSIDETKEAFDNLT